MEKIKVKIERTPRGLPALREVLESEKFLIVCDKAGKKQANKNQLVKIEPKDTVAVAINCGGDFRISIYEIAEIVDNNYMYVEEISKLKNGVWSELIPNHIEKSIIETINIINGGLK